MRTFTVVPSFEGESAFFELPDIGFQGDHLSFAILFNLTELTEHWPNILPSMIVTNPKGETFIAPHTRWNAEKHIFTWLISSTETTYDGYVKCQLKCMSADDPETIVCMSRICQTRVYQSLAAADDPPEAFQTWIDTLAQLGAEISADATVILESVEATETNARTAQAAAEAADSAKTAAELARTQTERTAQIATSAQEAATAAQQRAITAASEAAAARDAAVSVIDTADEALAEIDGLIVNARQAADSAADSATQAATSMAGANTAKNEAIAAKEAAQVAKGGADTARANAEAAEERASAARTGALQAQADAETAQIAAENARDDAVSAKSDAEAAQVAAEDAQDAAEIAKVAAEAARVGVENYADISRRWAEGKTYAGQDVPSDADQHNNNSKYWAGIAEQQANTVLNFGLYVDKEGNGFIRSL